MDKEEESKNVEPTAIGGGKGKLDEDEGEDQPSYNSLLGRRGRRAGNNLYIKIPAKTPEGEDDSE